VHAVPQAIGVFVHHLAAVRWRITLTTVNALLGSAAILVTFRTPRWRRLVSPNAAVEPGA
jgi:hypothetical protein